ncbi:MAG: 3-hydroxyacyl-CoA dehydrogenase NAD-binding domain-containing protein [Candidatus Dormibacteria bacterium]
MKTVAILGGGGLMGHGMVLACLRSHDTEVVLLSRRQESLDHGVSLVRSGPFGIERGVERGKITAEAAEQMLMRLRTTLDYEEGQPKGLPSVRRQPSG